MIGAALVCVAGRGSLDARREDRYLASRSVLSRLMSRASRLVFAFFVLFAANAAFAAIPNPVTEDYVLTENETIEGTLTVNSGVTVYLNGKTLTVSGLAGTGTISTSDTPEGYEQLEYAEATSDGRQYIDTGVKAISEANSSGAEM